VTNNVQSSFHIEIYLVIRDFIYVLTGEECAECSSSRNRSVGSKVYEF